VLPHRAYFGQKDAQQCAVIKRMARDLDLGVEIVEMPIVREADGLAMSSRNRYLSAEERQRALCISRAVFAAAESMRAGERDAARIILQASAAMDQVEIDYVALVDAASISPVATIENEVLLAVAAHCGTTRLIDNVKFDPKANWGGN